MPPEDCFVDVERIVVVEKPRIKPDVVHWKAKVGGAIGVRLHARAKVGVAYNKPLAL